MLFRLVLFGRIETEWLQLKLKRLREMIFEDSLSSEEKEDDDDFESLLA